MITPSLSRESTQNQIYARGWPTLPQAAPHRASTLPG
jgi:hypothetical protein